jgi:hypothetical protein
MSIKYEVIETLPDGRERSHGIHEYEKAVRVLSTCRWATKLVSQPAIGGRNR